MPNPPSHKRFQIHLSTAIVMMFVAGGLLWANVQTRKDVTKGMVILYNPMNENQFNVTEQDFLSGSTDGIWQGHKRNNYGWPCDARSTSDLFMLERDKQKMVPHYVMPGVVTLDVRWRTGAIVINIMTGIAILFASWFLCEWLIRRRAAQKGA